MYRRGRIQRENSKVRGQRCWELLDLESVSLPLSCPPDWSRKSSGCRRRGWAWWGLSLSPASDLLPSSSACPWPVCSETTPGWRACQARCPATVALWRVERVWGSDCRRCAASRAAWPLLLFSVSSGYHLVVGGGEKGEEGLCLIQSKARLQSVIPRLHQQRL